MVCIMAGWPSVLFQQARDMEKSGLMPTCFWEIYSPLINHGNQVKFSGVSVHRCVFTSLAFPNLWNDGEEADGRVYFFLRFYF